MHSAHRQVSGRSGGWWPRRVSLGPHVTRAARTPLLAGQPTFSNGSQQKAFMQHVCRRLCREKAMQRTNCVFRKCSQFQPLGPASGRVSAQGDVAALATPQAWVPGAPRRGTPLCSAPGSKWKTEPSRGHCPVVFSPVASHRNRPDLPR